MPASPVLTCAAILFDFDGVLFDTTRCVDLFWRAWAADVGLPAEHVLENVHGRREVDTIRQLAPRLVTSTEQYYRDRPILDEELTLAAPYPGVPDLLRRLPPDRFAIVTSGHRRLLQARLAHVGLALPPHTVTAEDVGQGKPAPEPYLAGAALLGVEAADCVVFEDAPPGIAAGKAAGARVIAIASTHDREELAEADRIVGGLAELEIQTDAAGRIVIR